MWVIMKEIHNGNSAIISIDTYTYIVPLTSCPAAVDEYPLVFFASFTNLQRGTDAIDGALTSFCTDFRFSFCTDFRLLYSLWDERSTLPDVDADRGDKSDDRGDNGGEVGRFRNSGDAFVFTRGVPVGDRGRAAWGGGGGGTDDDIAVEEVVGISSASASASDDESSSLANIAAAASL